MSDWVLNLPGVSMRVLFLGATYTVTGGIDVVVTRLAANDDRARAFALDARRQRIIPCCCPGRTPGRLTWTARS